MISKTPAFEWFHFCREMGSFQRGQGTSREGHLCIYLALVRVLINPLTYYKTDPRELLRAEITVQQVWRWYTVMWPPSQYGYHDERDDRIVAIILSVNHQPWQTDFQDRYLSRSYRVFSLRSGLSGLSMECLRTWKWQASSAGPVLCFCWNSNLMFGWLAWLWGIPTGSRVRLTLATRFVASY